MLHISYHYETFPVLSKMKVSGFTISFEITPTENEQEWIVKCPTWGVFRTTLNPKDHSSAFIQCCLGKMGYFQLRRGLAIASDQIWNPLEEGIQL